MPRDDSYSGPTLVELSVRVHVDPSHLVPGDRWQVDPPPQLVPVCFVEVRTSVATIASDAFVPLTQVAEHVASAVTRYMEATANA